MTRYTRSHPPESGHRGGKWGCITRGQADGVGLVVTPALRLTVLDLDDCVTPDGLTPGARAVIDQFAGAYVEFSPSGRGLHGVTLEFDPNLPLRNLNWIIKLLDLSAYRRS
ncbi:hypothetical protein [Deinococcus sp.]|uniref:hypothetical protein n=1 Tax=Deinococcus sp. TaxID=47478 RepID=UPI003919116B